MSNGDSVARGSEDFFRLAESVPHIVWSAAPDGSLHYCSERGLKFLGAETDDAIRGASWAKFVHPDDLPDVLEAWEASTKGRTIYRNEQRLWCAPERTWRWHLVEATPVPDENGDVERYYGISTDIHDRRLAEEDRERLEKQLRTSQKLEVLGRLAAGVAHDFNNILTTIVGSLDLVREGLPERVGETDPVHEDLHAIQAAAEHATVLTAQMLSFGRRQVNVSRPVHLHEVFGGMDLLLGKLVPSSVHVDLEVPADLPPIVADVAQLEQVVLNLVMNACDAMVAGGRLTIRVGPDSEGSLLLAVGDTGVGMSEETIERVFEPFFTTKGNDRGTGLGLPTVADIVQKIGGDIAVESHVGVGTTFRIRLPVADTEAREEERLGPVPIGAAEDAKSGECVLVCDDDPAVLDLVRRILTDAGYRVLAADSVGGALDVAREAGQRVDLLLTDFRLGEGSGQELAIAVRKARPKLPVLFMTGLVNEALISQLDTSMHLLRKPFSGRDLLREARQQIDGQSDG